MLEIPLHVWRIAQDSDARYLLILQSDTGYPLPMVIGPCEAMSIWAALNSNNGAEIPNRPMTHDLLCDLIARLKGRLVKVIIDDLWNGIYYAKLHIALGDTELTVDARPSDAVAVALRVDAPLLVTESVLMASEQSENPHLPPQSGLETIDLDDL